MRRYFAIALVVSVACATGIVALAASPPLVNFINPMVGPTAGGTGVQIFGSNLSGTTAVHFGANAATAFTNLSASQVRATAPAGVAGNVHVTVTTAAGTSVIGFNDIFTYTNQPGIQYLTTVGNANCCPLSGPTAGGTVVRIIGFNLAGATAVYFGGTLGTSITNDTATSLNVTSPAHFAGLVDVRVTTPTGTSALTGNDLYSYSDQPVVQFLSPPQGPTAGGTVVQIAGFNLTGATAVNFGGTPGTSISNVTSTSLTVTSPARFAGVVDVRVTTAKGTSAISYGDMFTYSDLPVVQYLNPFSGGACCPMTGPTAGGTVVQVGGLNLNGATAVHFGAALGTSISNVTATSLDVTSPAHAAGVVHVTVTTAKGTSAINVGDTFTYSDVPVIQFLGPAHGPLGGGQVVHIIGNNFSGASAVHFGANLGTSITNVTPTSLDVTAPAGSAGTVRVTVTATGGTSLKGFNDIFTYTNRPTIDSVGPNSGPTAGGTVVHITGVNLSSATAVHFGPNLGTSIANDTATSLDVTAPAGVVGNVDITVTTAAGTSLITSADLYAYCC